MSDERSPAIMWFRRDLRLAENPALGAATRHSHVAAVFVLEPGLLSTASERRRELLYGHLQALHHDLKSRGGGLVVREGPAARAIPELARELDSTMVYVNADASPYSRRRDATIEGRLSVPLSSFHGLIVHEPGAVVTAQGRTHRVFSPFHRKWSTTPWSHWPEPVDTEWLVPRGVDIPTAADHLRANTGERSAIRRLSEFTQTVDDYEGQRDRLDLNGTSRLSVDLKFGTLSPRRVVETVGTATKGRASFVRQLAWRDWWAHLMTETPDLASGAMRPEYDRIRWRDDPADLNAWQEGRTGYPVVDAGMRELVATGWIHNRVRMICASFLVKDLLIDWRVGERFFRHHLNDGDVAQNVGNWQWVAGTGPDASPYFRVFNPITQSREHDPEGAYIRKWVPELANLPPKWIHQPAAAPPDILSAAGVVLGESYPEPVVDHSLARQRAIDEYKRATSPSPPG